MKKIELNKLSSLYEAIAASYELYLPVKTGRQTNFKVYTPDCEPDLDTVKTVKSPKDAFFPQSETLYSVRKEGRKLSVNPKERKNQDFVVFGIRNCDVRGVEVLDQVFLKDYRDSFYEARREHGILVALACHDPADSCFCSVFGIDPAEPEGDVACWMRDGYLYWNARTEKGERLTGLLDGLLTDCDSQTDSEEAKAAAGETGQSERTDRSTADGEPTEVTEEKREIRRIAAELPYAGLPLEGWDGNATEKRFSSPLWEELYKPCLACGTCTFVCPTCQCYDIKDYDTGKEIQRYRCWDSCMYSDFTLMAAANNRTSQMQRFRQRFMHKLVYFPANNDGMYSCVGCGRCVEKCPSHLNIVKVIKAFAAADAKANASAFNEEAGQPVTEESCEKEKSLRTEEKTDLTDDGVKNKEGGQA